MAAEENSSMATVVSAFILGNRQNINDPKEIRQIEKKHNVEPDYTKEAEFGKCQVPNTRCFSFGKKYKITYLDDDGRQTVEHFLCQAHQQEAQIQAESVEEVI